MKSDPGPRIFHCASGILALDHDVHKQEGRQDRPARHGEREVLEKRIRSHEVLLEKTRKSLINDHDRIGANKGLHTQGSGGGMSIQAFEVVLIAPFAYLAYHHLSLCLTPMAVPCVGHQITKPSTPFPYSRSSRPISVPPW
jgi:hypothetical protein